MPKLLKSIQEYIEEDRKQNTIFINFSPTYNKTRLGIEFDGDEDPFFWLKKRECSVGGKRKVSKLYGYQLSYNNPH